MREPSGSPPPAGAHPRTSSTVLTIALAAVRLERTRFIGAAKEYRRMGVLAVGLLVFAIARVTGGNEYLASFCGGMALATAAPRAQAGFEGFGDLASELLKLAAVFVFGSLLSPRFLAELPAGGWGFALVALFLVRPLALLLALAGSDLSLQERLVAAWFGPKGFASVVYGLYVVSSGVPDADVTFHLVAVTTALSIVLHSSSDVPVARWFDRSAQARAAPA